MNRSRSTVVAVVLMLGAVPLSACAKAEEAKHKAEPRFELVKTGGEEGRTRLRLAQKAFDRIGIETGPVQEIPRFGGETVRLVIDYSALVYESAGDTSVYTNPEPLLFVRQPVTVEYIERDRAVLLQGPPVGTQVVTVGASELLGMELGVGK